MGISLIPEHLFQAHKFNIPDVLTMYRWPKGSSAPCMRCLVLLFEIRDPSYNRSEAGLSSNPRNLWRYMLKMTHSRGQVPWVTTAVALQCGGSCLSPSLHCKGVSTCFFSETMKHHEFQNNFPLSKVDVNTILKVVRIYSFHASVMSLGKEDKVPYCYCQLLFLHLCMHGIYSFFLSFKLRRF